MKVFTVATERARGFDAMLASARRSGIEPEILGWGLDYPGHMYKLRLMHSRLASEDPHQLVLFHDAYDVLFARTRAELSADLTSFDLKNRVLFSAEINCYPQPALEPGYPSSPTPYRFLNTGGYAGHAGLLRWMLETTLGYPDNENDQLAITCWYLGNLSMASLDVEARIFQSLWGAQRHLELRDGAITNHITNSRPSIIHGNGHSDMTSICGWLGINASSPEETSPHLCSTHDG